MPGVYSNNLKIKDVLLDYNLVPKISSYNLPLLDENMDMVRMKVFPVVRKGLICLHDEITSNWYLIALILAGWPRSFLWWSQGLSFLYKVCNEDFKWSLDVESKIECQQLDLKS